MRKRKRNGLGAGRLRGGRFVMSFTSSSSEDKYLALQVENKRLRDSLRKLGEAYNYWKEQALHYQAERDLYREDLQEQAQEKRNNDSL